jgi:hypothetical protein
MNTAEALIIAVGRLEDILKNDDGQAWKETAKVLPQLQQAAAKAQQIQPVLTVEKEPDYWSGGHFYEGMKSWINPAEVWALPIGTKLYAVPNHTPPVPCSGGPYVG